MLGKHKLKGDFGGNFNLRFFERLGGVFAFTLRFFDSAIMGARSLFYDRIERERRFFYVPL